MSAIVRSRPMQVKRRPDGVFDSYGVEPTRHIYSLKRGQIYFLKGDRFTFTDTGDGFVRVRGYARKYICPYSGAGLNILVLRRRHRGGAMPRTGRIVLPGYPHHVVQRGHNRQVVFATEADFRLYLDNLRELKDRFRISVYAYCLMSNHVHLLLAPRCASEDLGRLMKALAARATRYRNRLESRSGTLWESRYKSSPVDTDRYLLACCRYIELNPVCAGIVETPLQYPWSSFRQRMGHEAEDWIERDSSYLALADNEKRRRRLYNEFVTATVPTAEWKFIRDAVRRSQLTGDNRFVAAIEEMTGQRVEHRGRGRPRRRKK